MKYGVIEEADLVRDLHEWSTLYVSGRMHKPVRAGVAPVASGARVTLLAQVRVLQSESADVRHAAHLNLRHALHVALLLLPRHFTTTELYMARARATATATALRAALTRAGAGRRLRSCHTRATFACGWANTRTRSATLCTPTCPTSTRFTSPCCRCDLRTAGASARARRVAHVHWAATAGDDHRGVHCWSARRCRPANRGRPWP